MMKKILSLFVVFVLCSGATYLENEQKYFFSSDVLIEALQNNVTDEQKRVEAATKYSELMNQQTGMVSIDNLFAICRAAGFNTYKSDGFNSCKQFINALIELDEDALSGFCPGLDAKGNNPNGLKSITDKTRIGDSCSSTNIYAGEVVFKKGYNCTCMAYACNEGYEFKGGSCVTMVADGQGFCLRSDNKIQKDMKLEEAKAFCEDLANKNKCKFKSAVILHKELRILCNATRDEVDHAKQLMFESKEKQKANMKYYEVCDDDNGKSGGKEYCVKGVFNWVNVGQKEAVGLAQEYAKVKNGHNVICAEGYRTSWNDDYIKCATGDKKFFYEFQFDDVVESVDADTANGVVMGLEAIYGKMSGCSDQKIITPAKKYGLQLITRGNNCYFGFKKVKEDELATIEGLDNRVFYDDIQIKGSQQIEEYLKKYIRGKNITITSFSCDNGYRKMDKALMMGIKETDDVLRCVLNNKPIDFVFDDMSELSTERSEAGHAGINCKISGGKYAGKRCHGLSKQQCDDMDAQLKRINPRSAGTTWQDEQCILVDVRQQNYVENGIQIGLSVISLADCATTIVGNAQGVMGCTLAVVEITGLATELTTGNAMQNRAQEFIAQSMKCKEHACALTTIRDLAPKVVSIQDALKSASTAKAVDEELARLIDLLEPEDLKSECKGDCNYQDLISALGGDPSDASGTALKVANKVGFVAQFASLAGSAFRLTSKAIAKLGAKAAKTADAAGDVARAVSNTARAANAADDVSDATKAVVVAAANAADDVSDATKAAGKADDVIDAVWDATAKRFKDPKTGKFVSSASVKAVDNTADVARTGNKAADVAQTATVVANKTDDVADATRAVGKVDDIAKTEKEATDAMAFVDANRLRNGKLNADELNRLRKYYPDLSDAELQAKAQSISKELDTQRLMHGGMTDAEVRAMEEVQRAANGGMTNIEKAVKEYKAALKLGSENVRLSDGWVYIFKSGYTDDMVDAAGLKFHLNVAPDDVERVAPIIQRIVSKYDIPQWKFSQTASDLVGTAEEGKQFTLYMGKSISKNETLLKQLASEIDQTLGANGIRTGRVGENLATGDRLVPGSKFVHYRYDRVDDMGNIAGYNNSYKFVVPKTGDVIKGTTKRIDNATDAARGASKADDVADVGRAANNTGDAYVARFGNIKMAQKDEDIILDAIAKKQAGNLSDSEHIKAIRTMDKYFDQGQAVRYAQQMRQDIIESVRLNVDEFTRAGDSGEDIARFFVKHLGPKYGIKPGQLKVVSAGLPEGYAQYVDGVIYINSNMKALDFDQLTNLVIHEFGHAIDDLAPQHGVIGRALNAYGDMNALYVGPGRIVDKGTDMYKLIPTERSSHLLGDIVSGTENYGNTKNGSLLSKEIARLLESNNATDAVRGASKADDVVGATKAVRKIDDIFPDHVNFGDQGFYMSRGLMSENEALRVAETMNKSDGVIAQAVPVEGTAGGRYKVISITESDAEKLGAEIFSGLDENGKVIKSVFRNMDNTDFLRKLDLYRNKEITRIGNTPVFIEDVGSISGRGIVTVRVGEKKIPFYVSSGQAGKVDVPTGKWEVFWGIGEKGWFNKGNVAQINSHYGSSELRQIAAELDAKLGDPRNIEDVMATAGRKLFNGQGIVGTADIGNISREQINSGLKYTPASTAKSVMTGRDANIQDVVSYLRKLH